MAKATGKNPTQNTYSLLLQTDLEELEDSTSPSKKLTKSNKKATEGAGSGDSTASTTAFPPGYIPTPAERKKMEEEKKSLAEKDKQGNEKQQQKKQQPAQAADVDTAPAAKSKLSREKWDKNKSQFANQVQENKPAQAQEDDGFQPARPPKQQHSQQPGASGQDYRGGRGGRGGRGRGGRFNNDNNNSNWGDNQQQGGGGRFNKDNNANWGDNQQQGGGGGRFNNNNANWGDNQQQGGGGRYNNNNANWGDNQQQGGGGRFNNNNNANWGDNQQQGGGGRFNNNNANWGENQQQGGRFNNSGENQEYRGGRGGRGRGGRGRGGRRYNRNFEGEQQGALEENTNREYNQRGEDLTGERPPRKRQFDRRSGRPITKYGDNNVGDFPTAEEQGSEWTSAAPPQQPNEIAEGWGDNTTATTAAPESDLAASWDAIDQSTSQAAPSQPVTTESGVWEKPKPKEPPTKGLDDYLVEQKKKSEELAALLASHNVATSPRTIEKDESGGRYVEAQRNLDNPKKKDAVDSKSAKTTKPAKSTPKQLPLDTLFKFESNRPPRSRFIQEDESTPSTDQQQPADSDTSGGRRPRRGLPGAGGQSRRGVRNEGRRGNNNYNNNNNNNNNNPGRSANEPVSISKEDEWPTLVYPSSN